MSEIQSEHAEQVAVIAWAREHIPECPELALLHAIPNGARLPFAGRGKKRYSPQALRLKAEGLLPGVSDLFLPVPRHGYHGLYLEMKRGKGGRITPEQIWFLEAVQAQGYAGVICCGALEAIPVLQAYLGMAGFQQPDIVPEWFFVRCRCARSEDAHRKRSRSPLERAL